MNPETLETRRLMLAEWYLATLQRHDRILRSERERQILRILGRTYYATGWQLQNAVDSAYHELHLGLARNASWGADVDGRPLEAALVGLAQRRLHARLIDEIRRSERTVEVVDMPDNVDTSEFRSGSATTDPSESLRSEILSRLTDESPWTQAAVLLSAAGFTAPETATLLGLNPAAVRQRISRFGKQLRAGEAAA